MRCFTVAEYEQMVQRGIITEDDNVELLEGWIIGKMGHNPPHDGAIQLMDAALRNVLPEGRCVRVQSVLTTADSQPEPDLAVVKGGVRAFLSRHPNSSDTDLVVESAEATLEKDRTLKGRLYARAGIVCYWILNLVDRQIEVYTDPTGPVADPQYRSRQDYRPGDAVPLVLDGREVARLAVADLLP
jgi:hypothetical protein